MPPVRLRRREGPVSADRLQPRRAARGDRLQLRLQEAVLRGQRLLRARHELPQLHRLRRRVQVGDVGRVGQEGRRGRHRRASTTCSKRYPIDPKRVGHTGHSYGGFMTNWLITQYPDRFAAAITGAGISNWMSDYGTADIYRTKETEFFGTPWDKAARDRMIHQSPLAVCRQREDADAVRARRSRSARALRRRRADVLRAEAPRRAGEDDPLRRTSRTASPATGTTSTACSTSCSGGTPI